MVTIDDGLADARASQISLMNKFTAVYKDSAIKNTPDFEINISSFWKEAKKWIATRINRTKQPIYGQLSRNEEFESKYTNDTNNNSNWFDRIIGKYYQKNIGTTAANHLHKFEESFFQYENFFDEWKKTEENRFIELDIYISAQGESLDRNQVDLLMKTSDSFKGLAEELAPKLRQLVERLEELNKNSGMPNRYKYLAAKIERSFEGQIEGLLDFSDYYRGYARAYDLDQKLSEVFEDVDSLFKHLEVA